MVQQQYKKKIRIYTLVLVRDAVVNATFTGSIQIDPGVNFYATSFHASDSSDGAALGTQEPFLANAQDNEGSYLWADNFVERSALFGDRILGYQLPDVMPISQNTRVTFTLRNRAAGAVAGTTIVELRGYSLVPV